MAAPPCRHARLPVPPPPTGPPCRTTTAGRRVSERTSGAMRCACRSAWPTTLIVPLLRRTDDGLIELIAHEPAHGNITHRNQQRAEQRRAQHAADHAGADGVADERPQIPGPGHARSFSRQIAAEAVISSAVISR